MRNVLRFILLVGLAFSHLVSGNVKVDLPFSKPGKAGMDTGKLKLVDQKMEELIKQGRLAGGIVVVARKGKVAHFGTYGKRDLEMIYPLRGIQFSVFIR